MRMLPISKNKLKAAAAANGLNFTELSELCGHTSTWVSNRIRGGGFNEPAMNMLCRILECKPEDLMPTPPEPKPTPVEEMWQTKAMEIGLSMGYEIKMAVRPKRCTLAFFHEGEELYRATSYIKEDSQVGLMQAVSYAAHMLYKAAEQKKFQEEENA